VRKRRLQNVELSHAGDVAVDEGIEERVADRQEMGDVGEVLDETLDERERGALVLIWEGLSRREVAEELHINEGQVKRVIERARGKLRPVLERLSTHGRCGMLALTITDIAEGRIGPESPRWELGQKHLARYPSCRRRIVLLSAGAQPTCTRRGRRASAEPLTSFASERAADDVQRSATPWA
jgi:hypothetical protein